MAVRVGINGFGRIGRSFYRAASKNPNIEIVAANDLSDNETMLHLLKYDSNYGQFEGPMDFELLTEKDPEKLPWKELGVDIVIESTGVFRTREEAAKHLKAGAKKVIISAPAPDPDVTLVLGVNEDDYDPEKHKVVSMGSCTTNCLAPIVKILQKEIGIKEGMMSTIHAYTADQNLQDAPHKDLRRARSAAENITPTSTGAAKAIFEVVDGLSGKLDGLAFRVPVKTVSAVDLVVNLEKETSKAELNELFKKYSMDEMKGILTAVEEPLVSVDFIGNPYSSIVDLELTQVVNKKMAKIVSWYDNEMGYSHRLADLCEFMGKDL